MGPLSCALWSIFRLIPRPISVFAPGSWLCAILPLSFAFPAIPTFLHPTRSGSRGRSLRLRWTKWRRRGCLKLRRRDADRVGWRRVGIVGNAKESGNIAQSQEPGANTEIGLGISRNIDHRAHESGPIQHSPGSNHPGTMWLRRAEE